MGARARRLDGLTGHELEVETEFLPQLGLPLLDQAPGGDNETPRDVTPEHQFADEQPRHDRLAGTRVVGEQEPVVDGIDLVGIRIDV